MSKFHINSNDEAMPCKANKRACRFGESEHYEKEADAFKESERRLTEKHGTGLQKVDRKNKKAPESNQAESSDVPTMSEETELNAEFASSTASHHIRPSLGHWRLAVNDNDFDEMDKVTENLMNKHIKGAVNEVSEKFPQLTSEDKSFLSNRLINQTTELFETYKEDVNSGVKLGQVFDSWGKEVAERAEKGAPTRYDKNSYSSDKSEAYNVAYNIATDSLSQSNSELSRLVGIDSPSISRTRDFKEHIDEHFGTFDRVINEAEKKGYISSDEKAHLINEIGRYKVESEEIKNNNSPANLKVLQFEEISQEVRYSVKRDVANGRKKHVNKVKAIKNERANKIVHDSQSANRLVSSYSSGNRRNVSDFIDAIDQKRGGGSWLGSSGEKASYVPIQTDNGTVEMVVKNNYGLLRRGSTPTDGKTNHIIFKANGKYFRIDGEDRADGWGVRWSDETYEVKPVESDLSRRH